MYITGTEHQYMKWIHRAHIPILTFDVIIVVMAVNVWYDVKQNLPEASATVRVIAQQWAWTFVHPGPDNVLDTADDITTINELHVADEHALPLQARGEGRAAQLLGARLPPEAGCDPGTRHHGLVRADDRPASTTSSARRSAASATVSCPPGSSSSRTSSTRPGSRRTRPSPWRRSRRTRETSEISDQGPDRDRSKWTAGRRASNAGERDRHGGIDSGRARSSSRRSPRPPRDDLQREVHLPPRSQDDRHAVHVHGHVHGRDRRLLRLRLPDADRVPRHGRAASGARSRPPTTTRS